MNGIGDLDSRAGDSRERWLQFASGRGRGRGKRGMGENQKEESGDSRGNVQGNWYGGWEDEIVGAWG